MSVTGYTDGMYRRYTSVRTVPNTPLKSCAVYRPCMLYGVTRKKFAVDIVQRLVMAGLVGGGGGGGGGARDGSVGGAP